jgi:hypothetical protein
MPIEAVAPMEATQPATTAVAFSQEIGDAAGRPSRRHPRRAALIALGVAGALVVIGAGAAVISNGSGSNNSSSTNARTDQRTRRTTTTTEYVPPTTTTLAPAVVMGEISAKINEACPAVADGTKTTAGAANEIIAANGVRWGSITNAPDLAGAIGTCAQNLVNQRIGSAQRVDVDAMIKNPDAFTGQYFTMVTEISQYDAATGTCAFRGYWDNDSHEYNYEYAGDNALFESGDGVSACPVLTGIDQNDVVRVWVRSEGSYSYDTQIGGSTTVPKFEVVKAELIRKA